MSTTDSPRDAEKDAEKDAPKETAPVDEQPPTSMTPVSPVLGAAWLLRTAALTSVAAAIAGVILAPGMRGNASGRVVDATDRVAATLGYAMYGLMLALILRGVLEVLRVRRLSVPARVLVVCAAGVALATAVPALKEHLPPPFAIALTLATVAVSAVGASAGVRATHTRAVGVALAAFAVAAVSRLGAWELAAFAGERASTRLFDVARGLATAGIVFEGVGQLVSATWLGTRGRLAGQLMSSAAIVGAFVLTWGVAAGVHAGAAPWQAVMHTALGDAVGLPRPFALETLGAAATFLVSAGILLAFVAAAQPRQVVAVVVSLSLALLGRGAFDVPLRALAAVTASLWLVLATADDRAMWKALIADREQRGLPLRSS